MQANWSTEESTLNRWRELVSRTASNEVVIRRRHKNVCRNDISLSKNEIWRVFVGCQVTTQQRSGPSSPASRFLRSSSPALSYMKCKASPSVEKLVKDECKAAGLRRGPTVAKNLSVIFDELERGEWKKLKEYLNSLVRNTTLGKERVVVKYLQSKKYPGLGQKQSRNFIQWLGLSRYEVPLDSRVLKQIRDFGANFVPSGAALTDEAVYLFVQEGIQQIAKALDMYPCELDAHIFSSFDNDDDEEDAGN